ncbi:hypothetical protein MY1884_003430 [Beauveria asiatica]
MPRSRAKERPPPETSRVYSRSPRLAQPAKKSVACSRCHHKKMKCSGETPCARCKAAGHSDSCRYVVRDRKIRVDQRISQCLNGTDVATCPLRWNYVDESQLASLLDNVVEWPSLIHARLLLQTALYQKFLNRFHSAYLLIENALRLGLSLRLNRCPGGESVRPVDREHCIRLWWTIYIMDRFWGLKCGLPVQADDSDIQVGLPAHLLDDSEREQLPDAAPQITSISLARLAGDISQELYSPRKPAGGFLQHEQSLLAKSRRWIESLPDSLKLKPAGDNSRNVTVLHLQFHYCVILAIRPALLHALPHKADSTSDSALDPMPANMSVILEICGHTAKHSISLCIYAWTRGFIGMLSYDFPAFLFSAALALRVTDHVQGAKVGEIPEVETAREILQILDNAGNIASRAFNLHLQSVMKSFEDHGRTAAAADKVPRSAVDKLASRSSIQSLAPEFDMAVESFSWLMSAETMTTERAFYQTSMQQFLANDDLAVAPQDTIHLFNDSMSPFWWLDQPLYTG